MSLFLIVKATPHKDCGVIAPEDFLSDEAKNVGNPLWVHEAFFEIWRKIGKLASRKAVRRSFCGVALNRLCRKRSCADSFYNSPLSWEERGNKEKEMAVMHER